MDAEIHFSCGGDITRLLRGILKDMGDIRTRVKISLSRDVITLPDGVRITSPRTEVSMSSEVGMGDRAALENYIKTYCGTDYRCI